MTTEQREKEIAFFNETFFEEYLHQDMFGMPFKISNYWLDRIEHAEKAVREEMIEKIKKLRYQHPLLGTPENTENIIFAINKTIDEVLDIINPVTNQINI